ncbi:hypothetical protein H0E87_018585 [Populus deltoides]|uniref:Uncharacterized protein n=1 Tax=Populus deltoides TaxID=3696 RepID=A0A8T2XT95_POPDE|nr:hypothetical protein H0E87_018585 [Populus deltoides]
MTQDPVNMIASWKESQPLDDDEAPPVSSSTAGTEEVQKSFPDCSELQLHRREMGGCPVYQVAGCKDEGFQKDSSKMLQRTGTVLENANKQCHNGAVSKRYRFFSQLKKEKNKCKVMYDGVV